MSSTSEKEKAFVDKKKTEAQLRLAEELGDTKRGLYKHYKGGLYVVFSESVDEERLRILIHYYSLERRTRWTRTLEDFSENVDVTDSMGSTQTVPRFRLIRRVTEEELVQACLDNDGEVEES